MAIRTAQDFGTILADAALLIYRNWQSLLTALAFVTLPFIGLSFVIYFAFFLPIYLKKHCLILPMSIFSP
ncbi:MAG: hypothetical protein IPH94_15505 [Saprospiraceae bacterium]|nr:hypothetical protein [Saprospiraceae bacterium]